jgi:hypothetical protein
MEAEAMDFDEAQRLPHRDRVVGLRVKGHRMPFGGSWVIEGEDIVLRDPPTDMEPKGEGHAVFGR